METIDYVKRRKRFLVQSALWYAFLVLMSYYLTEWMLFYLVCGIYDVSRNSHLDARLVYRYFLGNGTPTWALAPFNIAMDVLTLPFWNKKIYQFHDLPDEYRQEISQVLSIAESENLVARLADRTEKVRRGMIFFKWYGINIDNSIQVPAFHRPYRYIKTIGVSIFNKQESTDEHFGPLRATLRVLYNINEVRDRNSYIKVRQLEHRWCDSKLFIFDDTLSHQSINQAEGLRYCLFIDIVRPSKCPDFMSFIVDSLGQLLQKARFVFYGSWVPLG
jgi:hypothetical protein